MTEVIDQKYIEDLTSEVNELDTMGEDEIESFVKKYLTKLRKHNELFPPKMLTEIIKTIFSIFEKTSKRNVEIKDIVKPEIFKRCLENLKERLGEETGYDMLLIIETTCSIFEKTSEYDEEFKDIVKPDIFREYLEILKGKFGQTPYTNEVTIKAICLIFEKTSEYDEEFKDIVKPDIFREYLEILKGKFGQDFYTNKKTIETICLIFEKMSKYGEEFKNIIESKDFRGYLEDLKNHFKLVLKQTKDERDIKEIYSTIEKTSKCSDHFKRVVKQNIFGECLGDLKREYNERAHDDKFDEHIYLIIQKAFEHDDKDILEHGFLIDYLKIHFDLIVTSSEELNFIPTNTTKIIEEISKHEDIIKDCIPSIVNYLEYLYRQFDLQSSKEKKTKIIKEICSIIKNTSEYLDISEIIKCFDKLLKSYNNDKIDKNKCYVNLLLNNQGFNRLVSYMMGQEKIYIDGNIIGNDTIIDYIIELGGEKLSCYKKYFNELLKLLRQHILTKDVILDETNNTAINIINLYLKKIGKYFHNETKEFVKYLPNILINNDDALRKIFDTLAECGLKKEEICNTYMDALIEKFGDDIIQNANYLLKAPVTYRSKIDGNEEQKISDIKKYIENFCEIIKNKSNIDKEMSKTIVDSLGSIRVLIVDLTHLSEKERVDLLTCFIENLKNIIIKEELPEYLKLDVLQSLVSIYFRTINSKHLLNKKTELLNVCENTFKEVLNGDQPERLKIETINSLENTCYKILESEGLTGEQKDKFLVDLTNTFKEVLNGDQPESLKLEIVMSLRRIRNKVLESEGLTGEQKIKFSVNLIDSFNDVLEKNKKEEKVNQSIIKAIYRTCTNAVDENLEQETLKKILNKGFSTLVEVSKNNYTGTGRYAYESLMNLFKHFNKANKEEVIIDSTIDFINSFNHKKEKYTIEEFNSKKKNIKRIPRLIDNLIMKINDKEKLKTILTKMNNFKDDKDRQTIEVTDNAIGDIIKNIEARTLSLLLLVQFTGKTKTSQDPKDMIENLEGATRDMKESISFELPDSKNKKEESKSSAHKK